MANLESQRDAGAVGGGSSSGGEEAAGPRLISAPLFDSMEKALKDQGPSIVSKVKGTFRFVLNGGEGVWYLNLKTGDGTLAEGDKTSKADVTLTVGDEDFAQIVSGKLNPQQAFMKGKLKIKGNMALAMKLDSVLKLAKKKANL